MKQRFGIFVGLVGAFLVAVFGFAGPAVASTDAGVSADRVQTLQHQVKQLRVKTRRVTRRTKQVCKRAKRARSRAAKRKLRNHCKASKRQVRKARIMLKRKHQALRRALRQRTNSHSNFDVCKHGCQFKSIQKAVWAAGNWQAKTKKRATVRIQPGEYIEGVYLYGRKYDHLSIIGVDENKQPLQGLDNARKVKLQGTNAKTNVTESPGWHQGDPKTVPANNAIEGRNIKGLVMKNMWAEHYLNNAFYVWAETAMGTEHCSNYVMDNLISSDTRSYGLYAFGCFGGVIKNSEGWNHGDSALYIGSTPCDDWNWTNRGPNPEPCQANPNWTVIDNVASHQNVLGYSGTNSKYVEIKNSAFFNNGAGIVPNTLDSQIAEPAGWMKIHDNDVFWNNYNYFSSGSEFQTVSGGLGEVLGSTINYPMGIGMMLFGNDGIEVKNNRIFGNEKWGSANFSAPVMEAFDVVANDDDDAKNMNNSFIGNEMGRNGLDPNQTDFLSDFTGGGNCWSDNTAGSEALTWVLGTGNRTQAEIYPACPQPKVINEDVASFDIFAGIQVQLDDNQDPIMDPDTVLGYAGADPAKMQECSWDIQTPHAAFTDDNGRTYLEKRADPVVC